MREKKLIGMVYEGALEDIEKHLKPPETIRGVNLVVGATLIAIALAILSKLSNIERELKELKRVKA